jgi:hypothetical protein
MRHNYPRTPLGHAMRPSTLDGALLRTPAPRQHAIARSRSQDAALLQTRHPRGHWWSPILRTWSSLARRGGRRRGGRRTARGPRRGRPARRCRRQQCTSLTAPPPPPPPPPAPAVAATAQLVFAKDDARLRARPARAPAAHASCAGGPVQGAALSPSRHHDGHWWSPRCRPHPRARRPS